MSAAFAALETRLNSACLRALANKTASVGGGSVDGIFDNGYATALDIGGSAPTFTMDSSQMGSAEVNSALVISGQPNYVISTIEPDGTGLVVLRLREA